MFKTCVPAMKFVAIVSFMVTLFGTYHLRSQVLKLNEIRFQSDNARADQEMLELKASYPDRIAQHEIELKNYELQVNHYQEMLELYRNDYDSYAKRLEDKYVPPQMPRMPSKPRSPELADTLVEYNHLFRDQQLHYFESSLTLNWVSCISSLLLVGSLLYLVMFDEGIGRFLYLAILIISFVFMIGPSFHSIMSAIVGFLRAPSAY